jgi:hypothetical protein
LLTERQQRSATPICQEAAEANAHKTARQCVKQEPSQKFLGSYGHQPLLTLVGIIFPSEGNLAIGNVYDPVIGDRDAMRIAGQVVEDMFGSSEWPFSVDNPVVAK